MIELVVQNVVRGDSPIVVIEENPEDRKKLADTVKDLLRRGHAVFVTQQDGEEVLCVRGYDADKNEWMVDDEPPQGVVGRVKRAVKRVLATGTKAYSVTPMAGG